MEKQLAAVSLPRLDQSILHLEPRDVKAVALHGLNILLLGVCEVSVIVPTLNEERYIQKCLSSLRKQNFDGRFEIIVVDGGSRDSTVNLAGSVADKVIIYEGRPVGDARNFGAKLAESSIVAFIDADTVASRNWLSSIKESLSCKGAVGVTGPTLPYQGSGLDFLAYRVATGWLQKFSMIFGLPHVAGFNCAYRREPFMRCGGFEEGRTLSEDLALSLKIRHEGRLLFNKRMIAYTSTRRVRRYGYVRLAMFYLLNDAIFALTRRSLYYPQVR
ncbi:glycosyltransferase [Candidatus Bathyarchaeota archaeon]|nr:glycosyltransferase [Candidatus Bathyarchaeota archaeon]